MAHDGMMSAVELAAHTDFNDPTTAVLRFVEAATDAVVAGAMSSEPAGIQIGMRVPLDGEPAQVGDHASVRLLPDRNVVPTG